MKKIAIITLLTSLIFTRINAQEAEIYSSGGQALKGFDPVAYFKTAKPVKGKKEFSYQWKNATWLFSTKENLKDFIQDPEKYSPQYGGYCAYGASQGHKAPVDPKTWAVINNKLYFNYNPEVQKLWNKDKENLIIVANKKWEKIKNK